MLVFTVDRGPVRVPRPPSQARLAYATARDHDRGTGPAQDVIRCIPRLDRADDVEALSDLAKYDIFAVAPWRRGGRDEELCACPGECIAARCVACGKGERGKE